MWRAGGRLGRVKIGAPGTLGGPVGPGGWEGGGGRVRTLGAVTEVGAAADAELGLNPFAPGYFEDPYAQYRQLREQAPVHHNPIGPWTVTRYEDCARILRDPRVSVEYQNADVDPRTEMVEAFGYERSERGRRGILNLDPPNHTRIPPLPHHPSTP